VGSRTLSGFTGAISLLTRIPVTGDADEFEAEGSVPWFPAVGAGIGVLIALVYVGGITVLPAIVAATLAAGGGALLTGALHEDGLADVADAFAGGSTQERRIEILDDPRLGTFGVMALTTSFLLRVGAISALDPWSALALIPAAHAMSRVGVIVLMRRLPSAQRGGLGVAYSRSLTAGREMTAVVTGVVLCVLLIGKWTLPAIVLCAAVALGMGRLARTKVGGISGDVLGAAQQLGELAILVLGAAVVHQGWDDLAWWIP
jgi:adenosylcobinamide-GDP ribazoletransferase